MVENPLLKHELTPKQEPAIPMTKGCQEADAAGDQGVKVGQIALHIAQLPPVGFTDLADP